MPHGIAINPLQLKFTHLPELGNSVYRIERIELPPVTELLRWPAIRGMDLVWIQNVEFGLTRRFEYEEGKLDEAMYLIMPELVNAFSALQIISPSPELHLTLAFKSLDNNQAPYAVSVPYVERPTKWALEVRHRLDEMKMLSYITERIQLATSKDLSRPHSALYLYLQGLRAGDQNMRTLFWSMGLDALTMAGNRRQFSARISRIFGPNALIFPASVAQQPQYTVGQVIEDLYTLRSEIAHGSQPSKPFQQPLGFLNINGEAIYDKDTWGDVLEQSAMFLLQRMLKAIFSTDLFKDVQDDKVWRRKLDFSWPSL